MTAPHKLLQNGYSLLNTLYFHDGNLTYREWKGKDVKEETGELEGKKSLFEEKLLVSEEIWVCKTWIVWYQLIFLS